MTGNRFTAFSFGAFITVILQSSGATSAIVVSFTQSGLLTFFQATAILLGADIGTTLVVILLSIRYMADLSLVIVSVGFFMQAAMTRRKAKDLGKIILGFGLVFYGMQLISTSAVPLRENEIALRIFEFLTVNPFASLIFAAMISGALHSAGTIGIAIALAFAGTITFEAAVPIVLGANLGTCLTAILAGIGSGSEGKRVALIHVITKAIGVAVAFLLMGPFMDLINFVDVSTGDFLNGHYSGIAAKIAFTHIVFNVLLAVIFIPVLTPFVKLVEMIVPAREDKEEEFAPKYLDKAALETPVIAFARSKMEIMRIAQLAQAMFASCLKMFSRGEDAYDNIEQLQSDDDKIDILEKAVRFYLAEISAEELSEIQSRKQLALLSIASDLEEIGDTMSREMATLATKKAKRHIFFSDEGWLDLRRFQAVVMDNFELVVSMLFQPHNDILLKIKRHETNMNEMEQQLRQSHITRLHNGLKESFDTSSIHLDILANLRRINIKVTHIADMAMDLI
jgi:phosphate:Na+ symporter